MRSCIDWAIKFGKRHPKSVRISKVLLSALPAGGAIQEVAKILTEYALESVEDMADEKALIEHIDLRLTKERALTGEGLVRFRDDLLTSLDSVLVQVTNQLDQFELELRGMRTAQDGMQTELELLRKQSIVLELSLEDQLEEMKIEIEFQNQKISAIDKQQDQLFAQHSDQALAIVKLRESISSPEQMMNTSIELLIKDAESAFQSERYQRANELYTEVASRTSQPKYELCKIISFLKRYHYEVLSIEQGDEVWNALKAITKDEFCKTAALLLLNEMKVSFYDARHLSVSFPPTSIILQTIKASTPPSELIAMINSLVSTSKYDI